MGKEFETVEVEIYTCKRCDGLPWLQRGIVQKDGEIKLTRPKNCTHCKSAIWNKSKNDK